MQDDDVRLEIKTKMHFFYTNGYISWKRKKKKKAKAYLAFPEILARDNMPLSKANHRGQRDTAATAPRI